MTTTIDDIKHYVHQKLDEYDNDYKKITAWTYSNPDAPHSEDTQVYVTKFISSLKTNPLNYKCLWEMYEELHEYADQDKMLWSDKPLILANYIFMVCDEKLNIPW